MSAFTPGPWATNETRASRVADQFDRTVATAGCDIGIRDQWEANAVLIAAAPDLLAACQKFVDSFKSLQREKCDVAHRMAVEAIAKAEGA